MLICCLCATASYAQKPTVLSAIPCCDIVGINTAKGIITSRNTATGKVQHFKTSPARISSLRIGDKLTLQGGKITAVNQTGYEPVNEIEGERSDDAHKDEIEVLSLQVNESDRCCDIVTVKNRTTGQIHSFKTMGGIGRTLTLGQSVNLQNGYAMVQSGANATAAQKGMYAFKVGLDSSISGVKENNAETSAEKWVITPTGAKGATGTLSINLPEGVEWHLDIKSSDDRALGKWDDRWNNKKTINLIPGE